MFLAMLKSKSTPIRSKKLSSKRDEADLDRDLQVLHPPQLLQEIDDLLVDLLRLADHQAQVRGRGGDIPLAAVMVPRRVATRSA